MGLTEETFQGVLEAAKSGAEWAWGAIYRELAGPVTSYLASRGASEPEDVASEAFIQVARGVDSFVGGFSQFRSWVFVIAHRKMIDDRRRRSRRPIGAELDADVLVGGDVESEAIDRLTTLELRRAFNSLTNTQSDVLALRIIGGLSLEETASVLGKTVGSVKAAQHRALESLQAKLDIEGVSR
jgi:RNA polymerase sigma factor (sigma-70 family)